MLKQILSDMYVDPELLAELNEEQKQILFFKMRQEQVRRWKEREAVATTPKPVLKKDHGKSVQWKLGADGDIWVWVMGEHMLDKPYDLLCSEILAERVKQQSLHKTSFSESLFWLSAVNPLFFIIIVLLDYNITYKENRKANIREIREEKREVNSGGKEEKKKKKKKKSELFLSIPVQRSKAADEKRRSLAKHARDDYKRLSLQGIHKNKAADVSQIFKRQEQRNPLPPPLPPKPKNLTSSQRSISSSTRESINRWFKEEQINFRAGFEKSMDQIAPWFHGILTTKKAEELLEGLAPGSFLIRVSEKIKGYVLSYLSAEGCKHFLIDASGDSYSFLGVDQLQHSTLADLVEFHKDEPITSLGKERLYYPCGQQGQLPDYLDLFE
uniref:SH2 domain containing 4A n=1 Tax=Naja naja TaxID=35670 RepID=A0A8C7E2E1_NAJNA